MSSGINWDIIKEEMESSEWEEVDKWTEERRAYIGSVLSLSPSGKFYAPWANHNVEICEACVKAGDLPCDEESPCNGKTRKNKMIEPGDHCEACQDATWYAAIKHEASEHHYWITSECGDVDDMFAVESLNIDA